MCSGAWGPLAKPASCRRCLVALQLLLGMWMMRRAQWLDMWTLGEDLAQTMASPKPACTWNFVVHRPCVGRGDLGVWPLAFLGLATPHVYRFFHPKRGHVDAIQGIGAWGALLALLADGVVRWTDSMAMHWPLNAVLAILGAPVVLAVLWKRTPRLVMNLVLNNTTCRAQVSLYGPLPCLLERGACTLCWVPMAQGKDHLARTVLGVQAPLAGQITLDQGEGKVAHERRPSLGEARGFCALYAAQARGAHRRGSAVVVRPVGRGGVASPPVGALDEPKAVHAERRTGAAGDGRSAMLQSNDWLMLDEPTAFLDVRGQRHLWGMLTTHLNCGGSVMMATHDLRGVHRWMRSTRRSCGGQLHSRAFVKRTIPTGHRCVFGRWKALQGEQNAPPAVTWMYLLPSLRTPTPCQSAF